MKFKMLVATLLITLFLSLNASADRAADEAAIKKALGSEQPSSIKPSKIEGLYEVVVGANVLYVSGTGRYLLQGEMFDTQTRQSMTEPSRKQAVNKAIGEMGKDNMIVFSPKTKKHSLTVFTDIDCGYCRKLHGEMDQYMAKGIEVRYMMFPRAGKNSGSYKKAISVWCADDRNDALTKAKAGGSVAEKTCNNPIDEHMQLAQELGLRGTPLVILEDGRIQSGYLPVDKVAQYYDQLAN